MVLENLFNPVSEIKRPNPDLAFKGVYKTKNFKMTSVEKIYNILQRNM